MNFSILLSIKKVNVKKYLNHKKQFDIVIKHDLTKLNYVKVTLT